MPTTRKSGVLGGGGEKEGREKVKEHWTGRMLDGLPNFLQ